MNEQAIKSVQHDDGVGDNDRKEVMSDILKRCSLRHELNPELRGLDGDRRVLLQPHFFLVDYQMAIVLMNPVDYVEPKLEPAARRLARVYRDGGYFFLPIPPCRYWMPSCNHPVLRTSDYHVYLQEAIYQRRLMNQAGGISAEDFGDKLQA